MVKLRTAIDTKNFVQIDEAGSGLFETFRYDTAHQDSSTLGFQRPVELSKALIEPQWKLHASLSNHHVCELMKSNRISFGSQIRH